MIGKLHSALVKASKILSRKGLYEFLADEFALIPNGSKLLSVGSGGEVNSLLRKFAETKDLDIVEFDIDPARDPDVVGDICSYRLDEQVFDVVLISEVLEHVHSPHLAIENIRRTLKEGGRLILTTPFIFPIHEQPHDYYRYTRYGLAFLLDKFRDVRIAERNSYFEAIDVLWLRLAQTESERARWVALVVIPIIFLKWPLTRLLSLLVKSDHLTTGYVVSANK